MDQEKQEKRSLVRRQKRLCWPVQAWPGTPTNHPLHILLSPFMLFSLMASWTKAVTCSHLPRECFSQWHLMGSCLAPGLCQELRCLSASLILSGCLGMSLQQTYVSCDGPGRSWGKVGFRLPHLASSLLPCSFLRAKASILLHNLTPIFVCVYICICVWTCTDFSL